MQERRAHRLAYQLFVDGDVVAVLLKAGWISGALSPGVLALALAHCVERKRLALYVNMHRTRHEIHEHNEQ